MPAAMSCRHVRAALWKSPRSELLRPSANSHVSEGIGSFSPHQASGTAVLAHVFTAPSRKTLSWNNPAKSLPYSYPGKLCDMFAVSGCEVETVAERTDRGKKEQQVEVTCSRSHNQSMAGAGSLHRSCGSEGHVLCPTVRCLLKMLSLANAKSSGCKYKIFANWFMLQF